MPFYRLKPGREHRDGRGVPLPPGSIVEMTEERFTNAHLKDRFDLVEAAVQIPSPHFAEPPVAPVSAPEPTAAAPEPPSASPDDTDDADEPEPADTSGDETSEPPAPAALDIEEPDVDWSDVLVESTTEVILATIKTGGPPTITIKSLNALIREEKKRRNRKAVLAAARARIKKLSD